MAGEVSIGAVATGAQVAPSVSFAEGGMTVGAAMVSAASIPSGEALASSPMNSPMSPVSSLETMSVEVADSLQTSNMDEVLALDTVQRAEELGLPELADQIRSEYLQLTDQPSTNNVDLETDNTRETTLDGDQPEMDKDGNEIEEGEDGEEIEETPENEEELPPDEERLDESEDEDPEENQRPPEEPERFVFAFDIDVQRQDLARRLASSGMDFASVANAFASLAPNSPAVEQLGFDKDGGVQAAVIQIAGAQTAEDVVAAVGRHHAISIAKHGLQAPNSVVTEVVGSDPFSSRRNPFGKVA